eukprot:947259-Amphidinium_carterae.1
MSWLSSVQTSTCAGTCVAASSGSIPGSISASPAPRGIHAELALGEGDSAAQSRPTCNRNSNYYTFYNDPKKHVKNMN